MIVKKTIISLVRQVGIHAVTCLFVLLMSGFVYAQTATIGGNIYKGQQVDGLPDYTTAPALLNAKVMVQHQDNGDFVAYGTISGNTWTATVPSPGDYVVMFSRANHEVTSREFTITEPFEIQNKDAYLPPLPLPLANLLVYTFFENDINGEWDDGIDAPLNGVTVKVLDDDGNILATGITGTQPMSSLPQTNALITTDGYYYFTDLPPGKVKVVSDASTAYLYDVNGPTPHPVTNLVTRSPLDFDETTGFYLLTTEEGGSAFEAVLYPGDPGTEDGNYMVWHGFVQKLGQIGSPTNPLPFNPALTGSITSTLIDADQVAIEEQLDPFEAPDPPLDPYYNPGVRANTVVPNGLVVLHSESETFMPHAVATVEPDPVTGEFTFNNVPPGRYKMFCSDLPLNYVFVQQAVSVLPGQDVIVVNNALLTQGIMVPRFFGRVQGYVMEGTNPVPNAEVHLKLTDGSIWDIEYTDANGWYNFDDVPEVEVLGYVDVALPDGYRGKWKKQTFYPVLGDTTVTYEVGFNAMNRYVQWFTANYQADLFIQKIPAAKGHLDGFVFLDNLDPPQWLADGIYDPEKERTIHGVKLKLWNETDCVYDPEKEKYTSCSGTPAKTTKSGEFNKQKTLNQGWNDNSALPIDEWGGVFAGKLPGYYEFRNVVPGNYIVQIVKGGKNSTGYVFAPGHGNFVPVTIEGGESNVLDFGLKTLVPMAGTIEGGVFDDLFIDPRPQSLMFMEKAGIEGIPVGVYDHLGYFLGAGYMGSSMCYPGASVGPDLLTQCPAGQPMDQTPVATRRFAPATLLYMGNDPYLEGYNADYLPLIMNYSIGQGKYKFEADWSLIPIAFGTGGMQQVFPGVNALGAVGAPPMLIRPVITNVAPTGSYMITGENFGAVRGFSTVTLSGRELVVTSWSDTEIHVEDPAEPISGPMIVTTHAGPSNAVHVDIAYDSSRAQYMAERSVFVNASNTSAENGSKDRPWSSINEAMDNLPTAKPRFIFVAAGYYNERVQFKESDIQIIGAGPNETVIDGLGALQLSMESDNYVDRGPVFFIGNGGRYGGVSNIMISGLSITGGSIDDDIGGGIFGDAGNSNIDINTSILNHNGGYYGGAIWLQKSNHNVRIWSNTISFNGNPGGYGGGISVNDEPAYGPHHGEPEHVIDDEIPGCPPGTYEIFNNHIFNNFSPDYGGGIALYEVKDHLIVAGNLIENNHADDHGGAVFFEDSGPIDLYGNIIRRNSNYDDGAAVSFEDVTDHNAIVRVYNNLIAENWSDDHGENHARGAALAFDDTFYAEVFNNTIVNNVVAGSRDPVGGAIDSERHGHEYNGMEPLGRDFAPGFSDVKLYNNIIWGNMRLKYDQQNHSDEEDLDWSFGTNHTWTPDNIHVDDPYAQTEAQYHLNSEAYSHVESNCIDNGEYVDRTGNTSVDPQFIDPDNMDWHLASGSSVSHMGAYADGGGLPDHLGTVAPLAVQAPMCNDICYSINEVTVDSNGIDVTFRGTYGADRKFDPTTDGVRISISDGSGYTVNDWIPAGSFEALVETENTTKGKSNDPEAFRYAGPVPGRDNDIEVILNKGNFTITTSRMPKISRPIGTNMMISLETGEFLGRESIALTELDGQLHYARESQFSCTPDQPVEFEHKKHVNRHECQDCHTNAAIQADAGLPDKEICFECHIYGNKKSIDELEDFFNSGEEIPWIPMAILRQGVSFSHSTHVTEGQIDCLICHEEMPNLKDQRRVVYRVMTMRECRVCHEYYGARNDCEACHTGYFQSGYYISGE